MEPMQENQDDTRRMFGIGVLVGVAICFQLAVIITVMAGNGYMLYRRWRRLALID